MQVKKHKKKYTLACCTKSSFVLQTRHRVLLG